MLRVTTLHAASAAAAARYYTQYLTAAPGEEAGVWAGRQAAGLGLTGEVTAEALQALLEGRDPVLGTPLGNPLVDRVWANGTTVRAVAGFDATFSAPKSLSVWWALTGDPERRAPTTPRSTPTPWSRPRSRPWTAAGGRWMPAT